MAPTLKDLGFLNPSRTAFFMCDIQEKFRPLLLHFDEIVSVAKKLVEVSKILNIPLIVSEQNPIRSMGKSVSEIDTSKSIIIISRTRFSMIVPEVERLLIKLCDGILESVVLFGMETHICIEQTAIELISKNIKVHIVADATSSRNQADRLIAFDRLRQIGCFIATSESIIFKLLGDKEHLRFSEIRNLVKESSPNTGLIPISTSTHSLKHYGSTHSIPPMSPLQSSKSLHHYHSSGGSSGGSGTHGGLSSGGGGGGGGSGGGLHHHAGHAHHHHHHHHSHSHDSSSSSHNKSLKEKNIKTQGSTDVCNNK